VTPWTAAQLPKIALRILAERDTGREVDPHRIAWAEEVLRIEQARAPAAPQVKELA